MIEANPRMEIQRLTIIRLIAHIRNIEHRLSMHEVCPPYKPPTPKEIEESTGDLYRKVSHAGR